MGGIYELRSRARSGAKGLQLFREGFSRQPTGSSCHAKSSVHIQNTLDSMDETVFVAKHDARDRSSLHQRVMQNVSCSGAKPRFLTRTAFGLPSRSSTAIWPCRPQMSTRNGAARQGASQGPQAASAFPHRPHDEVHEASAGVMNTSDGDAGIDAVLQALCPMQGTSEAPVRV